MSYNLYARIDQGQLDAFYDADPEDRLTCDIEGYEYDRSPSIGAKKLRDNEWLPAYLVEGVWLEYEPPQARMYAEALADAVDGRALHGDVNSGAEGLLRIADWLRYWAEAGATVEGSP